MPSYQSKNILKVLCCWDLNSVWARSPCCFSKSLQKRDFLDIYLTTAFQVGNFENTSAMRTILLSSIFTILYKFQKCRKKGGKVFPFRDNGISIDCVKLSLLRREYLWPAVTVLKNSRKILPIAKRDFFELYCFHSDQYIW